MFLKFLIHIQILKFASSKILRHWSILCGYNMSLSTDMLHPLRRKLRTQDTRFGMMMILFNATLWTSTFKRETMHQSFLFLLFVLNTWKIINISPHIEKCFSKKNHKCTALLLSTLKEILRTTTQTTKTYLSSLF